MAKSSNSPKRVVKTASKKVVKTNTSAARAEKKRPVPTAIDVRQEALPFTKTNYILLIIGIVVILAGFVLMSTGEFVDATEFSVALYIAPILVVGGFVEIIYAIMYRSDAQIADEEGASLEAI